MRKAIVESSSARSSWRMLLLLFLLLLVYDGVIRKWLLPGIEQFVLVLKDILILAGFAWYFIGSHGAHFRLHPVSKLLLSAYAVCVLAQMWNTHLPNTVVGMWGVKAHLLYATLLVLLPLAFDDVAHVLRSLQRIYPYVVIPVATLGLVQLQFPGASLINQNVRGGLEGVAYFGDAGLVRVSGTFSYLSGMASFVQAAALAGIGLFLAGARSRWFLAGLGFALIAVPVTGSRSVVAVLLVGATILWLGAFVCRLISGRYAAIVGVTLAILAGISLGWQRTAWEALEQRAESARFDQSRAVTAFTNAFTYFGFAGPFGFGAGATNHGAPSLAKDTEPYSWLPFGPEFEEESGRIVIELGIVGWVLSLAMRASLFYWAGSLALAGRTIIVRTAGLLALPVTAFGFWQGTGVFAPPLTAAYYWFCVGLLAMAQREHTLAWSPGALRPLLPVANR